MAIVVLNTEMFKNVIV